MILIVTTLLVGLVATFYFYLQKKWQLWTTMGIPVEQPKFPWGSVPEMVSRSKDMDQVMLRIARDHNWAPVVGGYMMHSPRIFIQDPELAKAVMVKDFSVFHDRMSPSLFHKFVAAGSKADNVMMHQLTLAPGELWRNLRTGFIFVQHLRGFLGQVCHFEICFYSTPRPNPTDDHKYSPLPSTDFDIAEVLVSFSAFIFS